MKLVQEKENAYGVILAHPGVRTSTENLTRTNSVAQIVVRVPTFLEHALQSNNEEKMVYLYDSTVHKLLMVAHVSVSVSVPLTQVNSRLSMDCGYGISEAPYSA